MSSLGGAARQHQWFRAEDSPLAAELLSADTSCVGAEAAGNKEPKKLKDLSRQNASFCFNNFVFLNSTPP